MPPKPRPGVFCLEGPWNSALEDKSTVEPVLQLLENRKRIKFIHRETATREEFTHYMQTWAKPRYAAYKFGYLAFHGSNGVISIGRTDISLDEVGTILEGQLAGRTLYFGSRGTLRVQQDHLHAFRDRTKARAVCGYTRNIDWIESAAFELNLMQTYADFSRIGNAFNFLRRTHPEPLQRLGFRAVWENGSIWD